MVPARLCSGRTRLLAVFDCALAKAQEPTVAQAFGHAARDRQEMAAPRENRLRAWPVSPPPPPPPQRF